MDPDTQARLAALAGRNGVDPRSQVGPPPTTRRHILDNVHIAFGEQRGPDGGIVGYELQIVSMDQLEAWIIPIHRLAIAQLKLAIQNLGRDVSPEEELEGLPERPEGSE